LLSLSDFKWSLWIQNFNVHTFANNILLIVGGAIDENPFPHCIGQDQCPDNDQCNDDCKDSHYFRGGKCIENQCCCRPA